MKTYEVIKTLEHPNSNFIWAVALSPDNTILASGDEKGILRLWNIKNKEVVYEQKLHRNRIIRKIIFHPTNSSVIASCGEDGKIYLLNIQNIEDPEITTLPIDKPYEKVNIYNTTGLSVESKKLLKTLGAIDEETI